MEARRRIPNLFLIGAMKSGTRYLTKLLSQHPDIFMGSLGEPSYFVPPKYLRRYWYYQWKQGLWKDEKLYLALFADAKDEKYLGDGSTNYAKLPMIPGVPEAISKFNPESRFIYLLRDPIKRTISHYWHNVRYHSENRPMLEAFRNDREYLEVSHYAMQLRRYAEIFGLEKISVLTFEDLTQAPDGALSALFGDLGIDATFVPPGLGQPEHSTPPVVEKARGSGILKRLRRSELWDKISPHVPRRIRSVGTRLAETEVAIRSVEADDAVDFLRPIQKDQTEQLCAMLGTSFPRWTNLYGES